jgi:hypothetical protein
MKFEGFNFFYVFIVIASIAMIISLVVIALRRGNNERNQ